MTLEGIPLRGGFLVRSPFHTVHTMTLQMPRTADGSSDQLSDEARSEMIESSIRDIITLRHLARNEFADFLDSVHKASAERNAAFDVQEAPVPIKLSEEFPSGFALAGHSNVQNIASGTTPLLIFQSSYAGNASC